MWVPFERQKVEFHIFDEANLSDFVKWESTNTEDLIHENWYFC